MRCQCPVTTSQPARPRFITGRNSTASAGLKANEGLGPLHCNGRRGLPVLRRPAHGLRSAARLQCERRIGPVVVPLCQPPARRHG